MMKIKFLTLFIMLIYMSAYGQYSEERISTDSSEIEIIKNSLYKIFEETYKHKDSIWYRVTYIKKPTQVQTEGWKTKNNTYLGTWKEYTKDEFTTFPQPNDNN